MRIILDLPDTTELEAVASELARSRLQARERLGFALQRAIQAAVRESVKPTQPTRTSGA